MKTCKSIEIRPYNITLDCSGFADLFALFKQTQGPARTFNLALHVTFGTSEKQGHCQVGRTEVPEQRQERLTHILNVCLIETYFFP